MLSHGLLVFWFYILFSVPPGRGGIRENGVYLSDLHSKEGNRKGIFQSLSHVKNSLIFKKIEKQ